MFKKLFHKKLNLKEYKEKRFEELIAVLEDGVITYTPNFTITSLNKSAERILAIKKDAVLGKKVTPALKNDPAFSALAQVIFPSLAPMVVQVSESGWPQITEMELEASELKLRATLTPITDSAGVNTGFIKIIRDKTRQEEILESKREFLDVAAHQLRTPLTGIHWAFETLGKELEGDEALHSIVQEGEGLIKRSLKIVNDLLDAARIEGGKFGYTFAEVNLDTLVRDLASQAKLSAQAAGLTLSYTPSPSQVKIQGDAEKLSMALSNLIDNAIKYNSENGSITIYIEQVQNQPYVRIAVQDTGIGMSQDEQKKLFRKFERGEKATRLQPNGSGLGLFIAKNIAKNHGGDIFVESSPNRGTTFFLALPTDPARIPRRETTFENE